MEVVFEMEALRFGKMEEERAREREREKDAQGNESLRGRRH